MAQRKPVIIDGCVTDVAPRSTLADVLPSDVWSVQTHDGRLVRREHFAQVPVPDGFETNLSPINKGAGGLCQGSHRERRLGIELSSMERGETT